jgi:hypothetical protein
MLSKVLRSGNCHGGARQRSPERIERIPIWVYSELFLKTSSQSEAFDFEELPVPEAQRPAHGTRHGGTLRNSARKQG